MKRQVETWRQMCPDFEFYEWNDSNVDYSGYPYWKKVYSEKRWAFASNIVSYAKVLEHGGFYLDCDVTMCKPLDTIPVPGDHLLLGYMYDCAISGGFFYAPAGHPLLQRLLDYYRDVNDGFYVVNNTMVTDMVNNTVEDFLLNGRYYTSEEEKLFPKVSACMLYNPLLSSPVK